MIKELGYKTLLSVAIYAVLFAVLYILELSVPALRGVLLQWQNPAFVVGIPASVIGTAYVLTITNPNNYLGFYFGIIMSLLLACQFYLLKSYDLVVLYLFVFIPFLTASIISWKKPDAATPHFLTGRQQCFVALLYGAIVALDYVLATTVMGNGDWGDNIAVKIAGGSMIASSTLANFLLIYKKNDAWINWVLYALSGIVLYALVNNIFSLVLFVIFFIVNSSALFAWIKPTHA